jgi:hypothetical protein
VTPVSKNPDLRNINMVSFQKIQKLAEQHNLTDDLEIQKLLRTAASTEREQTLRRIHQLVKHRAVSKVQQPFPQPTQFRSPGKQYIQFGQTPQGNKVWIPVDELSKHMLLGGTTGAGKTDTTAQTLFELSQRNIPWWVFDLKQDYRHLADDPRIDCLVVPVSELLVNLLRPPPRTHPDTWLTQFAEIFCDSVGLLDASFLYLSEKASELFQQKGVYTGGADQYPTLTDLRLHVEGDGINYQRVLANYRDRVLNRLRGVESPAFSQSQSIPLEELVGRNVVWELDGKRTQTQNVVMELFQAWLYLYRKNLNPVQGRGSGLRNVLVYDEGYTMYDRDKEQEGVGIPEIDKMTAQIRDFKIGVIVGSQVTTQLTDFLFANTTVKAILPMTDPDQFQRMADAMDLDRYQRKIARQLDVGEAVIKIGNRGPFHVQLTNFDLTKDVEQQELMDLYRSEIQELATSASHSPTFDSALHVSVSS